MGWWIVVGYVVVALFAFRASVYFAVHESDYGWDMTDTNDVVGLTVVSGCVALLWPLALVGGLLFLIVKGIFANEQRKTNGGA